ncbi:MAG: hypothetical protein ACAI25_17990 [Planctomycetota bacterium]
MGRTGLKAALSALSLLLLVSQAKAQDLASRYELGDPLGSGVFKTVYSVKGHPELVVGILKDDKPADTLLKERGMLRRLEKIGCPVAKILELGTFNGKTAYVQKAYVTGNRAESWDKEYRQLLNEKSLADVAKIRKVLTEARLDVLDAQFLVGADGSVVLNDPLKIERLSEEELTYEPILAEIETRARQAIEARKLDALLRGMPGAEDAKLKPWFEKGELFLTGNEAGKKELKEALLHYLESGESSAAAREVAAAVRSGKLVLELDGFSYELKSNKIVVGHNQTFPKVAADLVLEGVKKLHPGASPVEARLVGTARALEFLKAKKAPAGFSAEPYVFLHSNPAALVRLAGISHPPLDDAERARLELVAHRIFEAPGRDRGFERGGPSATPGALGGVDRIVRERSRVAVPERR